MKISHQVFYESSNVPLASCQSLVPGRFCVWLMHQSLEVAMCGTHLVVLRMCPMGPVLWR